MSEISASTQQQLGSLSKEQAQLLQLLLQKSSSHSQTIAATARDRTAGLVRLPASWAQRQLWFIDQLEGGRAPYYIAVPVRLCGNLDQVALQNALDGLVGRHEVLRTVFVNIGGEVQQEIADAGRIPLSVVDLSTYGAAAVQGQVRFQQLEAGREKFDLRAGPLIRARLLKLQRDEHLLLVTMHHIVADGWSVGVLLQELADLYGAFRLGYDNSLAVLPIQYGDYAQWQRQGARERLLEDQLSYWSSCLDGAAPQLELPTDRPRPSVQSYRGANVPVCLDAQLTAQLRTLAQRHQMTLFMVLYAGWAILLSRLSGQTDVVMGTAIANRPLPELEGLIGLFVNTLVLRAQVGEEQRLPEFLAQVREVTRAAYAHRDVPFERVVEKLQPQRSLGRNPLFQVMFTLHSTPKSELELPGLKATLEQDLTDTAMFDLLLSLEERGDEIVGAVNYATDLFQGETIERWLSSFNVLLTSLAREASARIRDLPILSERDRSLIVSAFNATDRDYPRDERLEALFEEQVRLRPNALAVQYEEASLTYAQLNTRANQLAQYLAQRGVKPGEFIPVLMPRCLQMLIAQLATIKCGGVYVPLDPQIPEERLAFMLADCGARRVLTTQHAPTGPAFNAIQWIDCEALADTISTCPKHNPEHSTVVSAPAYVMYTSGSTGRAKGVVVPHRAVIRLVINNGYADVRPDDCIAHCSNPAFDASTFEIWGALLNGARVMIVPPSALLDPGLFADALRGGGVTVLFQTTALFNQHAITHPEVFAGLRYLLFGGEAADSRAVKRILQKKQVVNLLNVYGPTETTTFATWYPVTEVEEGIDLPIGRPIANTRVYILDGRLQPVPVGVVGEIYIGGAGVATEYLNQPQLTSERFVADPFNAEPRARLYKSGDLGRWRADGNVEFLGRNDRQVKLRGFRIELGEVETRVLEDSRVKQAVVVAHENVPGDKRLVAYITRNDAEGPNTEELRARLRALLPEYMVPSAFVMMESFPLTPNGKLDYRALPPPEFGADSGRQYEAPRGEVETLLATFWQDLLRMDRVGRQDNFFELGGHSLLLVQMMEKLRNVGLAIDVRRVFENPTLAALARSATSQSATAFQVVPNLIRPGCDSITPDLLPLVDLSPEHIQAIVRTVPGGAANVQDIYPLAPLQEGMLFHHVLKGRGADAYLRPILLSIASQDRLNEFVAALQRVIDRHDILRTAILWEQAPVPVQVVYREAALPVENLKIEATHGIVEQLKERMRPEHQTLELRRAPMMSLHVAADPNTQQRYALLVTHHVVCDAKSLEIMLSEVRTCMEGRADQLPPSIPYRNHVAQSLAQASSREAEAFFRGRLADIDEPTAPFGILDVHRDGSTISEATQALDIGLSARLRSQARSLGVTVATLFHAAWALVIAQTSGRDDVVFGSVLLGRLQGTAGAQNILGMFINTLPLRLRMREVSVRDLVLQTQREMVALVGYEQAPLAIAQRCSGISGSGPLFTALLNFRHTVLNFESEFDSAPGVTFLDSRGGTNYPILLSVDDRGAGFSLEIETDPRIDAQRMIGYVVTALHSFADALEKAPQTMALSLCVLPESEWQRVIESFNAPQSTYSQDALLHELFERQARRTPDSAAVVYEGQTLTYAELDRKSGHLAAYLRHKGVGPDQLVGICLERSLDMVVSILGVLKAGGAYVPLDPSYPAERLAYILEDAAPRVILTQELLAGPLGNPSVDVIVLPQDWERISSHAADYLDIPAPRPRSDHLAYVIYTSGSTGKPKGVMVEHRNVVRLFAATEEQFHFNEADVWTLFHSFAFDFSVWELWGALLYGGKLIVVPYLTTRSPGEFYSLLCEERVTVLNQTPSAFGQLIDAQMQHPARTHSLRTIIFGGEALELRALRPWVARNGVDAPQLVNMYGITETTVHVTHCRLTREEIETRHVSPVGRPIPDLRIYLLNEGKQPVPIGVTGELFVGGPGLARGYLNRTELTAQRFLSDPFRPDENERMYKTGDLGRWRCDGTLEYLGRNDLQVKIRGFRIELGEIETQLLRHPAVREAVVVARDVAGEKSLVAYVTLAEPTRAQAVVGGESLRAHLKSSLPAYMVPSACVILEHFPLTAHGKLDRRSLPAPGLEAYVSSKFEPPQGKIETALAEVWRELLRVARVGRHDNFFELGGNSLLATRVISRLRERADVTLPLKALFDSPTIEQLGAHISAAGYSKGEHSTLEPRTLGGVIPVSFAQERLWFLEQTGLLQGAYNVPLALRLVGMLDEAALARSFGELIGRHESLRTRFEVHGGVPHQLIDPPGAIGLQQVDLTEVSDPAHREERLRQLVEGEQKHHFDLSTGPLVRMLLVRLGVCEHAVLLTMHHIIVDGWSLGIIIRELSVIYDAFARGQPSPLQRPDVQYADFAIWQREWLRGNVLQEQLRYWETQLLRAPEQLELPTDRPRPAVASYAGGSLHFELSAALCDSLEQLARSEGATLFMVMLAAFQWLLHRYSGADDVVVGSPIAGRTHERTEQMIGFFVNTLVLRTDLSGDPTFRQLLNRARDVTLGAYAHQDVPFEKLVMELRPERNLSGQPIFQVMLALQNFPEEQLNLAGMKWSRIEVEQVTAKFDLVLFLYKDSDRQPAEDNRLRGTFEYATDLFDRATIARAAEHFQLILAGIAVDPDCHID